MKELRFDCPDESATGELGRRLAAALPDGAVCSLIGTLGAGKTRLVQAVAAASGVEPGVAASPTFVLMNEYDGENRPIYHFDAYRLASEEEFRRLGPDEYFEGEGLSFIEWADRVPNCLPEQRLEIRVEVLGESERRFELRFIGEQYRAAYEMMRKTYTVNGMTILP
ncbi:MAG TPA: tRNA (adenosine(37)-N6)-threonylcarbamoyltransferase complex ATPase subunit type 1 TsaE [Planctomycetaceae bacterium]|nr:tRNA (adenosine(37)-N6)-threonylcarbamoyltransferase complex ATPase subunit type 1 TsaE [Planctomycetaceae bacterium]